MGARFDGQALMVSELGWCGIGVVDAGLGNGLEEYYQLTSFGQNSSNLASCC